MSDSKCLGYFRKAEIALELPFHICLLQIQGRLTRVFPGMMSRSRKAGAIAFWPA